MPGRDLDGKGRFVIGFPLAVLTNMDYTAVRMHPDMEGKPETRSDACKYGSRSGKHRRLCSLQSASIGGLLVMVAVLTVSQLFVFDMVFHLKENQASVGQQFKGLKQKEDYWKAFFGQIEHEKNETKEDDRVISEVRSERSTHHTNLPYFFLKGNGKEVTEDNRFLWEAVLNTNDGPFRAIYDNQYNRDKVTSMQIKLKGVYYIFIQVKFNGRQDINPTVPYIGYSLRRNGEILTHAIMTQDKRGVRYGGSTTYALDTLTLSGIFQLEREDILTVVPLNEQTNDHRIQFYNNDFCHFGGFMLEGRG